MNPSSQGGQSGPSAVPGPGLVDANTLRPMSEEIQMSIVGQEAVQTLSADFSSEWVQHFVQEKTYGRVRNLTVILRAGVVHLNGRCAKYHTKQLASLAALDICAALNAGERFHLHSAIEVC